MSSAISGLAAAFTLAFAFVSASPSDSTRHVARSPIARENAKAGTANWLLPQAPPPTIEGYASELSVLPGQAVRFHVSTRPAASYVVRVFRLGWYGGRGARLVGCTPGCTTGKQGTAYSTPGPDQATGEVDARWPVTDVFRIKASATTGYYLAEASLRSGEYAGSAARIPFIVRAAPRRRQTRIVVQAAVNTWEAYNNWGGKSLYAYNSSDHRAATEVSFDRPWGGDAQSPLTWEYPLVRFLERHGFDVSYTTDVDTDRDSAQVLRHQLAIVAGHGEYWSKHERDAFDTAQSLGENLGFFGADIGTWQVRYAHGRRALVEYRAAAADPERVSADKAISFDDLGRPECALQGIEYRGGFARSPAERSYVVAPAARDDPWFASTGLVPGDVLRGLVGYEWDTPGGPCKAGGSVLFSDSAERVPAASVRYTAPSGSIAFSTGSLQFNWGLDSFAGPYESGPLERFVARVIADLSSPR